MTMENMPLNNNDIHRLYTIMNDCQSPQQAINNIIKTPVFKQPYHNTDSSGTDRTYCYENSNILKNKLNIQNRPALHRAEKECVSVRLCELLMQPDIIEKTFDIRHLTAIHKHLFQDLYDWAGVFRTVEIAKSNMFCRVIFLENQLNHIFSQLRKENYLQGINDATEMGRRLGYYLAEINAVHPFREGNGRTQREFIRHLAANAGYRMDYQKIPEKALLKASIKSFSCDYTDIQTVITDTLTKI